MSGGRGASSCINHPGIEAVARCKMCGKPVCGTCVVSGTTGKFCCEICREKHAEFTQRAKAFEDRKGKGFALKSKLFHLLGKLIVLVIVLAFVAVLVTAFTQFDIPVVGPVIRQYLPK